MISWDRMLRKLAVFQQRHALWITLAGLLLAGLSIIPVSQLGLNSAWTALLPKDQPSVHDLEQLRNRIGGLSTLTVAIQSKDLDAMQRFAHDLVPKLESIPKGLVRTVDWNVLTYENFVREHQHMYVGHAELTQLRDDLQERLTLEKGRANPFFVDLDDDPPPTFDELVARIRKQAEKGEKKLERFPGGFYVHPDRDLLFLFVRTDLAGGDSKGSERLIQAVNDHVQGLNPARYAKDLRVEYAGDVIVAKEEQDAIQSELVTATLLTITCVLFAIYLFFRRFRSVVALGIALFVPVLMTFALAEWIVDYLNTSTAFLASIVIGNGINPNIIWLARYIEERRSGKLVTPAIYAAHRSTLIATLTASIAAAVAYGSLVVTDFRGFRDFGIIGSIGMILCWAGATLLLPSLAALFEYLPSWRKYKQPRRRNLYGILFAKLVHSRPRMILAVSLITGAVALVLMCVAIAADPMEYDFRNLKSVRDKATRARQIQSRFSETVGSSKQGNGIAMLVPRRSDTSRVRAMLEYRRDVQQAPYGKIRSIDDLLPERQRETIALLHEIRALMLEVRPYAQPEQQKLIDEYLPPESLRELHAKDLPEEAARLFTEKDGTRGRILIVEEKKEDVSIWDGAYLIQWSDALRKIRLPDGSRPPLAGRAPVFADMLQVIVRDGPKAILLSFIATLLLVLLTFRRLRERFLTMTALLLGIVWMAGLMAALRMKLNFLNFVAFPITFGNGVDYGVNVMRRYAMERDAHNPSAIRAAIEETGGAVILCSLTTIIGYASLFTSGNLALNSFGAAMSISEITCLLSAVVTVPAIVLWLDRRRNSSSRRLPSKAASTSTS